MSDTELLAEPEPVRRLEKRRTSRTTLLTIRTPATLSAAGLKRLLNLPSVFQGDAFTDSGKFAIH
jgi:hypothetical protein